MKFTQMQLILGSTSIEDLYYSKDTDNDTLAEAMLANWEDHSSLVGIDESWSLLTELNDDFILDDFLNEYDSFKAYAHRTLILKVRDRYFAYYYTSTPYDQECYDWKEVKPIPMISYDIEYIPVNSNKTHSSKKSQSYMKIYE